MKLGMILTSVLFILLALTTNACADAVYTNDIDILDDSIIFTIEETYTHVDAKDFRQTLDADNSGEVNTSEIESFKKEYLDRRGPQFSEYILIDEGNVSLLMGPVEVEFENAEGYISNETLNITTIIKYEVPSALTSGEHELWVLGHPLIQDMKITLPRNVEMIAADGFTNMTSSAEDGRVVIRGQSGIRTFMNGNRTTFEYASLVDIYKKPFYARPYFLPLLIISEILLAVLAIYKIKSKK